ncbi:MAG: hypothetical protein D6706_18440 [Chloroflexi bacterium]|nr:MAG: hypothetical protein D6706_18440 [Chloroflexota bacterium]
MTTRWFYHHFEQQVVEPGYKTCAVCGLPTSQAVELKKILRKTFTDHEALRAPGSMHACPACEWYMGRQDLRRSGWWLTASEAREVSKAEWWPLLRQHILEPPVEDGYYLIKPLGLVGKHLALHAPLNMAGNPVRRVRFDVHTLDLDHRFLDLVMAAHRLREYHSWHEIQSGNYNPALVARWDDLGEFHALVTLVQPYLFTPFMTLAEFIWSKNHAT